MSLKCPCLISDFFNEYIYIYINVSLITLMVAYLAIIQANYHTGTCGRYV